MTITERLLLLGMRIIVTYLEIILGFLIAAYVKNQYSLNEFIENARELAQVSLNYRTEIKSHMNIE